MFVLKPGRRRSSEASLTKSSPRRVNSCPAMKRRSSSNDAASRGRYSTDASIYQVAPVGVVVPRNAEAAIAAMQVAIEEGVAVLPRGAGTSQCGQTVGEALVIDDSRYLDQVHQVDAAAQRAIVAPGVVLDALNAQLKPLGLWYPVDVSTSAQATLGGMTGNNSCGSRSLAYGNMVDRVEGIDAWLPDGTRGRFGAAMVRRPLRRTRRRRGDAPSHRGASRGRAGARSFRAGRARLPFLHDEPGRARLRDLPSARHAPGGDEGGGMSMIPKSGNRFSEKIMLKQ